MVGTQEWRTHRCAARATSGRRRTVLFGLVLVAVVLSGCAVTPPGTRATTPASEPDDYSWKAQSDAAWERVLDVDADAERPDVAMERFVGNEEWATTVVACLSEEGFDAEAKPDGGIFYDYGSQRAAYAMALYVCTTKYPVDPRYLQPLTDEQLAELYAYSSQTLKPCLEAQGLVVPDLPSLQVYLDAHGGVEAWNPYADPTHAIDSSEKWDEISANCPPYPPGLYG
ncbi:hypothetical protein [Protaetiibacter intestinalis]|uniref:hypothetical protein n=1 Tax=Protaetiibacter intestinalis TaxID=2419774 RepID=UPI0013009E08|nr:hypothetical protein [Protaetiibacter intestinalis]